MGIIIIGIVIVIIIITTLLDVISNIDNSEARYTAPKKLPFSSLSCFLSGTTQEKIKGEDKPVSPSPRTVFLDLNPSTESEFSLGDLLLVVLAYRILAACTIAACQLYAPTLAAFDWKPVFVGYMKSLVPMDGGGKKKVKTELSKST